MYYKRKLDNSHAIYSLIDGFYERNEKNIYYIRLYVCMYVRDRLLMSYSNFARLFIVK